MKSFITLVVDKEGDVEMLEQEATLAEAKKEAEMYDEVDGPFCYSILECNEGRFQRSFSRKNATKKWNNLYNSSSGWLRVGADNLLSAPSPFGTPAERERGRAPQ